jgi:hypothetical protein
MQPDAADVAKRRNPSQSILVRALTEIALGRDLWGSARAAEWSASDRCGTRGACRRRRNACGGREPYEDMPECGKRCGMNRVPHPETTKPARGGLSKLAESRRIRGAGEGIRTLDVNLGKVALYH